MLFDFINPYVELLKKKPHTRLCYNTTFGEVLFSEHFCKYLIESIGRKTKDFEDLISYTINFLYATFYLYFNVKSEKYSRPTIKVNMYLF